MNAETTPEPALQKFKQQISQCPVPSRMSDSLETADPISTQTDGFIRRKSWASKSRASRRINESSKDGVVTGVQL